MSEFRDSRDQSATPVRENSFLSDRPLTSGRKSVRATRQSRSATHREDALSAPTSEVHASTELQRQTKAPLSDITTTILNGQTNDAIMPDDQTQKPLPQTLERPVDIVVRTRARPALAAQEFQEPKQRTVITYLVLMNFKSYAGRQEVGPFHPSFSSVVGPNGSGKSNVIDSLLFVFGFRASKMRQGKVSALIHNSATFPDLGYCEVEVHFEEVLDQPNGATLSIPDSALIISRKAFKNNSSKYYINGSESSFTAVTTLLRERGVDLDHKRFLILQGEVESIAQMKPKAASEHDDGLLEYLEDIIGTSKYKGPIEESATEADALNDACAEKNNRVQIVERERKSLEAKKDTALAFIKDENDLAIKQAALYQAYVSECINNAQLTKRAVEDLELELSQEVEKYRGTEDHIDKLEKELKTQTKAFQNFKEATEADVRQQAKLDRDGVKAEERGKHLNTKLRKQEKQLLASKTAVSDSTAALERLSEDIRRNTATIAELDKQHFVEEEHLSTVRASLKGKTQGISEEILMKKKSLEPWTKQINEKRASIAVAQSELTILREKTKADAQAVMEANARIDRLTDNNLAKKAEFARHNEGLATLQNELNQLEFNMSELLKHKPDLEKKLSSARQTADEARASLSTAQTQGNVYASLMRLKESGRIVGLHGRLGNLGTIDKKYDVAISTACPALDNFVVDSVETGQLCIEHLRKNNLGRANFILLDRLIQRDMSKVDIPENVPRLFDLVIPKDQKFRPAFFNALQNTLVAQDLEQANRIAYGSKRWRVVTLSGQLIDKSGTMAGGGARTMRGLMSSKLVPDVSKEQVAKYAEDLEVEERRWETFQSEHQTFNDSIRRMKEEIPGRITQGQKFRLEIESIDRDLADAQRRHSELKSNDTNIKDLDGSLEKVLSHKIDQLESEIASFQDESADLEVEITSLQEKIMEIGGVKLRSQKSKVDGLRDQISTLADEVTAAEISKVKIEQQQKKHVKSQDEAATELSKISEEILELEQDLEKRSLDASSSKLQVEQARELLESKKEDLVSLKSDLESQKADLGQARAIEIEIRNKLEVDRKTLNENQKRAEYWSEKLNALTIHEISDLGFEEVQQTIVIYTPDEIAGFDKDLLKGEIAILEEKLQNSNVEVDVLEEYRRCLEKCADHNRELTEAIDTRDRVKKRCEELRRIRLREFMEGFVTISLRLKEMYQMITMGGNAELELVDSLDPFAEGILFSVMPPKKSWKNISNLSGGEKTLSSLALVFALHHYKPTPLYVMDEIDAALDFRNVSIVASYIKERTKDAQFIVISLRNNMFELASRLVGVYKVNHMTKSVTVENRDYMLRST